MRPVSFHPLKFWIRKCLNILIISSTYHGLVVPPYQLWLFFEAIRRIQDMGSRA